MSAATFCSVSLFDPTQVLVLAPITHFPTLLVLMLDPHNLRFYSRSENETGLVVTARPGVIIIMIVQVSNRGSS